MRYLGKVPSFAASRVVFDDGTEFSGSYTDLTDKPTIPAALTDLGISDGSNGQILSTDGAGSFVFIDAPSGGGTSSITGYTTPNDGSTNNRSVVIGESTSISSDSEQLVVIGDSAAANYGADRGIAIGYGAYVWYSETTAVGNQATAKSIMSTAIGTAAQATGTESTAIGRYARATASYSVAVGGASYATGSYATCLGRSSTASGNYATSLGYAANASGGYAVALGNSSTAGGSQSVVIGRYAYTNSSGQNAIAIGYSSQARNAYATSVGYQTYAAGQYSTCLGVLSHDNGYTSNIILNATNNWLYSGGSERFYVKPIRNNDSSTTNTLYYDSSTGEITYSSSGGGGGGVNLFDGQTSQYAPASFIQFAGTGGIAVNLSEVAPSTFVIEIDGSQISGGDTGGGGDTGPTVYTYADMLRPASLPATDGFFANNLDQYSTPAPDQYLSLYFNNADESQFFADFFNGTMQRVNEYAHSPEPIGFLTNSIRPKFKFYAETAWDPYNNQLYRKVIEIYPSFDPNTQTMMQPDVLFMGDRCDIFNCAWGSGSPSDYMNDTQGYGNAFYTTNAYSGVRGWRSLFQEFGTNIPPFAPQGTSFYIQFASIHAKEQFLAMWDQLLMHPYYDEGFSLDLRGYHSSFNGMRQVNLIAPPTGAPLIQHQDDFVYFMGAIQYLNQYPFGASETDYLAVEMLPEYFHYDQNLIQNYYGPNFYGRQGHRIAGVDF